MTRHPRRLVFAAWMIGLLLATLVLHLASARAGTAVRTAHADSTPGVVVRLDALAAQHLRPEDTLRGAEYGAFAWYEVTPAGIARLDQADVVYERVTDGTEILLNDYRFDPLVGEPALPPELMRSDFGSGPDFWLVQLVGPTKNTWLADLANAGAVVVQYHAQNGYAVWATADQAQALTQLPFVRWVGHYAPAFRLAPQLLSQKNWVRVSVLAYEPEYASVKAAMANLGSQLVAQDPAVDQRRYLEYRIAAGQLAAAARVPGVMAINAGWRQPGLVDEMSDKISAGMISGTQPQPKPPGYRDGFLTPVAVDGTGVVVHINDAGINEAHNDLSGRMVAEYGNQANHHGTHVAGIVLGSGFNNIADTTAGGSWIYGLGIAPAAQYIDEYFNCSPGTCGQHAIVNGANVSTNSWVYTDSSGNPRYGYGYTSNARTWDLLVQDANASTSGAQPLSIVAAAGNGGSGAQTIGDPWEAKNVISVASSRNWRGSTGVQGSGDINSISSFSSRGTCKDGRNCPVVAAPGQYVISSRYSTSGCGAQAAPNSTTHSVCSGTSMAAPHVAGVVALITEWWRDNHASLTPSPALVKAVVVNSATDMGTADIPNANEGWGRANVAQAISPSLPTVYWDQPIIFGNTGEEWIQNLEPANTAQPMKVSLVWTDAAGAGTGGTSAGWVNDLDLTLEKGGTTWRGNVFASGWSIAGGSADNKNNVENVYLQSPTTGAYTVKVRAANIAGDGVVGNTDGTDQDWALVCYNCTGGSTVTATPTAVPATATPSPTPPRLVVAPSDDARVYSLAPTSNFGFSDFLRIQADTYYSFLKFTVTGVSGPVAGATLNLFAFDGTNDGGGVHQVDDRWDEATITWSNAPLFLSPPFSTLGTVGTNSWAKYDVSSVVVGNGTYSFGIRNTSLDAMDAWSKEAATNKPELEIILVPVATATPSDTSTPAATATSTATSTATATRTATATATRTATATATRTATATATRTATATATRTATATATRTATATATNTPTATPIPPTATATATSTATATRTATATATNTPTATPIPPTATATATSTATATRTATATATNTPTATPIPPTATHTATAVATATPQVIELSPVADARVESNAPFTNFGSSQFLSLRIGPRINRSYLQFAVSGVSGQILSATLRLYAYDGSTDGGGAYAVASNWNELGITWSNAPVISGAPLDTVGFVGSNQWVEYDVTDAIIGNGTYSFGLQNASSDSLSMYAREATALRPELVLVVSPN